MRRAIAFAALITGVVIAVGAIAQTPVPSRLAAYAWPAGQAAYSWGWVSVDAPLALTSDTGGIHLQGPSFGNGFISASIPGKPTQVSLDTSYVSYRTAPPAAPGPCVSAVSSQAEGTGAWAVDSGFFYVCVPNADASGFVWARAALATSW